jgi:hypothetical protein
MKKTMVLEGPEVMRELMVSEDQEVMMEFLMRTAAIEPQN